MSTNFSGTSWTVRWLWLGGLCLALASAGLAIWWWFLPPDPPEFALDQFGPEVAEAIKEARQAVLDEPRSADAWGRLGQTLMANHIYEEGTFTCFVQAERLDPDNPRWPYFQAGALLNLGRPREALPKLRQAVQLAEGGELPNVTPRLLLAETLMGLGETAEAETHFREVLARYPEDRRTRLGLGLVAYSRQDWRECRSHLEACLSSPHARKRACTQLAAVCHRLGDAEAARKYAEMAAHLPKDPDWPDPYVTEYLHLAKGNRDRYRLAEQLEAQGRFKEAAGQLWPLVNRYPDDYLPRIVLGRVLAQLGDLRRGEEQLRKALQLAPDKFLTYYLLSLTLVKRGEVLLRQGDAGRREAKELFEEAKRLARHSLSISPDFGYGHMALGLALKHLGCRDDALTAFRKAVHCSPEFADNHLFLGIALAEAGKEKEARRYLEQARLLAGPNDPRPQTELDKLNGDNP